MNDKVELRTAFAWDCPGCGTVNFEEGILCELTPEERQKMRGMLELDENVDGDFIRCPMIVECFHCEREFKTQGGLGPDLDPHEVFGGDPL